MVALYEMLRVAKKAVILIEPQDRNILIPSRFRLRTLLVRGFQVLKNEGKRALGKEPFYSYGNYEEVGNYVYSISERELEKVSLGLNYEYLSFKEMNDFYISGVENEKKEENAPLFKQINKQIQKMDAQTKKGLTKASLLVAIIHKSSPTPSLLKGLEQAGFHNRKLPRNPHM